MSIINIHFEPDLEAVDQKSLDRLKDAIARYDRGEHLGAEEHLTFESFEGLLSMFTPKRLALLRHLRQHPARSVKALAEALERDYKRVHEDVAALISIGLIARTGTQLHAAFSEIRFSLSLDQPFAA